MENAYISLFFTVFGLISQIQGISGSTYPALRYAAAPEVKAVYWTAYTAGFSERRKQLTDFIKKSELNAVVVDVKDSTGAVFFDTHTTLGDWTQAHDLNRVNDLGAVIRELHDNGIYTIARVAVFQDPHLAEKLPEIALQSKGGGLWRDWKGLAWVDTSSRLVWQYNADIAKAAIRLGFDEINFDYIRFASDGNLATIQYPFHNEEIKKTEVIAEFFKFMNDELKEYPAYISVDLFGMTLWRTDGLNIGQRYQDASDYVDFISPMVYPSHYPEGFEGYDNPADYPYEIVFGSLVRSNEFLRGKRARIRPWLQDFDLGAIYDTQKIIAQKKATIDSGGAGWMFWNASNNYTQEAYF